VIKGRSWPALAECQGTPYPDGLVDCDVRHFLVVRGRREKRGKTMKTKTCLALLLAFCGLGATSSFSQSPPGSIPVGPLFVYPELELAVRRDTNIALQPDATRIADTIWIARPSVRAEAKSGANFYNVGYRAEIGRYATNTRDDYENHELYADAA